MIEAEGQIQKRYYSISEVATELNVNASLIRFWEKEFSQIKPKKNKKGNRLFTSDDVKNLKLIYSLVKEKGYTLEGARNTLKTEKKAGKSNQVIIQKLQRIKKSLESLKKEF